MKPLCSLQNLSLTYPNKHIFDQVTFTLNQGDKIGVLGLNGHGKSSLFKVLASLAKPDTTVPPFIFDRAKEFSLFYIPQELPNLDGVTIENYLYEFYPEFKELKLKVDAISQKLTEITDGFEPLIEEQTKIYETLTALGEDRIHAQYMSFLKAYELENLDRTMESLSGGEQRKVAIALGLSAPHEILLWDEPTNHLDLETIQVFEEELQNLKKTFMIISHDRSLLNNVVDRIVHIRQGKLRTFEGTYEEYLAFLVEDENNQRKELDKLNNMNRRETAWIRRGVSARRTKSKKRIEEYANLNETIRELKSRAHKSVSMDLKSSGRKTKALIQATDLSMSFGDKTLFENMSFTIGRGDKIALMGANGVGKSTLLKILTDELNPTNGNVHRVEGLDVGYFSQKRDILNDNDTPWNLIGEGIDFVISNTGEKRHVASYLESFLFKSEELKRPISTFSGGEKNRLQLAHFMKHAKDLWIFDEPTNDLDLETIGILEEELKNYKGAVIIVGHDRSFIENVTDKCFLIYDKHLEVFEAGFSQAQIFMEAVELERLQKKKEESKPVSNFETPKEKAKFSHSDKKRYEKVQADIEKVEESLSTLQSDLEALDYADGESVTRASEIQSKISHFEEKLESLMQEWEDLEKLIE